MKLLVFLSSRGRIHTLGAERGIWFQDGGVEKKGAGS
jgi:hypothetical protein